MKSPKTIDYSKPRFDQLQDRIKSSNMQESDQSDLLDIMNSYYWVGLQIKESTYFTARLRALFGRKSERKVVLAKSSGSSSKNKKPKRKRVRAAQNMKIIPLRKILNANERTSSTEGHGRELPVIASPARGTASKRQ